MVRARPLVAFSSRLGGVSTGRFATANISTRVGDDPVAVQENRRLILDSLGLRSSSMATAQQCHGATVRRVGREHPGGGAADGLVTTDQGVALVVGVADCLPVALVSPIAVGVLHVGWRGLLSGIVEAGVREMRRAGADPDSVTAHLGPRIGPCCLDVPASLRELVSQRYEGAFASTRRGTPSVDLTRGAAQALQRESVVKLETSSVCTFDSPQHFSARRDGVTGCQAGLVALL